MQRRAALPFPIVLAVAGFLCGADPAAAAKLYRCGPEGKTVQDTPCAVVNEPLPPPPKPPCELTAAQRTRAMRVEEQFLKRYPDAATHRRGQLADLQPIVERIGAATGRLGQLREERVPIDRELAFYKGRAPPAWLKGKLDANEAQFAALADILRGHEQAIGIVQARYGCERDTYGKLWTGAAPGASACDRPACAPAA